MIVAQIDETKIPHRLDLGKPARVNLFLLDWKVADLPIPTITKESFQETNLQGLAEIEDSETVFGDPAPRIAEPARAFSET